MAAKAEIRRERGRLLIKRPAPDAWRGPWFPGGEVRRCGCGARIVFRSVAFRRCERGCIRLPAQPSPPLPAPQPKPLPPPSERYERLLRDLRLLSQDFARDARRGRRPSPRAVALALEAAEALAREYPDRGEQVWCALAWLARRRTELAFLAGRAA